MNLNGLNHDGTEIRRENGELFEMMSGIVRAQAAAFTAGQGVQRASDRKQLEARSQRSRSIGNKLLEIARLVDDVARDCHDDAQRIDEQLQVMP